MRQRPTRPFVPSPIAFPGSGAAERRPEEPATLFFWGRERYLPLQVAAFVLFSLVLHGAGFYLFRVAYPPPVRYDSRPDAVSIIDRSDPASREILREIRDRAVYLQPPSGEWLESMAASRPEDFEIRFAPAFPEIEVEALDGRYPWSLPPATDAPPALPPASTAPHAGGLAFGGGLEDLGQAPWSILGEYLRRSESIPRLRLHLTAAPSGEVAVESISPELDAEDREALTGLVEGTLRFLPTESGASGWMEIGEGGHGEEEAEEAGGEPYEARSGEAPEPLPPIED